MTQDDSAKSDPSFNGWIWAMGGALVAGIIIGGVMWLAARRDSAAYMDGIAARDKALAIMQKEAAENMRITAMQNESLRKLETFRAAIDALQSKDSRLIELTLVAADSEARGRILQDSANEKYILVATSLAATDDAHEYAFWLIDKNGAELAGTFATTAENVAVVSAAPKRKVTATRFEVTLEKKGEADKHAGEKILAGNGS